MKTAIILYHTKTGHTKLLAELIKIHLEMLGASVEIYRDKDFKNYKKIPEYDIIAIGCPCHLGRIPFKFTFFITKILKYKLQGKKFISFGTSSDPINWYVVCCRELEKRFKLTGVKLIASIGCQQSPTEKVNEILDFRIKQL